MSVTQIQIRRDTAANWTSTNPVLLLGELGIETDTGNVRRGDGTSTWTQLSDLYAISHAPITLTTATNLVAATHGNRQIIFNGANATLTIQSDTLGGWATDAFVWIQTLDTSAGVPTVQTPDSKGPITGAALNPIACYRKGTNSWDIIKFGSTSGGGSTLATFGPGSAFGYVNSVYNFTTLAVLGIGSASATVSPAPSFSAVGTTTYSQMNRSTHTGTASTVNSCHVLTPLCFTLGGFRQRVVISANPNDTAGGNQAFLMGMSSALAAFTTTSLYPAQSGLGAIIGVGWPGDGSVSNMQLISTPATGGASYIDLGSSFPIPTTASTTFYQLQLDYYPTSDPGGRRVIYKLTELISGNTTSGTLTGNLIAQATAQSYCAGVARYTINTSSAVAAVLDFGGIYFGALTQWAP